MARHSDNDNVKFPGTGAYSFKQKLGGIDGRFEFYNSADNTQTEIRDMFRIAVFDTSIYVVQGYDTRQGQQQWWSNHVGNLNNVMTVKQRDADGTKTLFSGKWNDIKSAVAKATNDKAKLHLVILGFDITAMAKGGDPKSCPLVMLRIGGMGWTGWQDSIKSAVVPDGVTAPRTGDIFAKLDKLGYSTIIEWGGEANIVKGQNGGASYLYPTFKMYFSKDERFRLSDQYGCDLTEDWLRSEEKKGLRDYVSLDDAPTNDAFPAATADTAATYASTATSNEPVKPDLDDLPF